MQARWSASPDFIFNIKSTVTITLHLDLFGGISRNAQILDLQALHTIIDIRLDINLQVELRCNLFPSIATVKKILRMSNHGWRYLLACLWLFLSSARGTQYSYIIVNCSPVFCTTPLCDVFGRTYEHLALDRLCCM
jgi:hypothetical protein